MPRSGKSTLAKKWLHSELDIINNAFTSEFVSHVELTRVNNVKRIVVTPDAWRLALGHRYNWYAEPVVFSHVQVAIRALLLDYDVLVDDTNTSIESITRIFEVDPTATYVRVDTSEVECIQRAIACGQPDLEGVIKRMSHNIERLKTNGNFKHNFSVVRFDVINHASRKVVV